MKSKWVGILGIATSFFFQGCNILGPNPIGALQQAQEEEPDPAEVAVGERLFKETRFAELFKATSNGNVNAVGSGDPVLSKLSDGKNEFTSPFAGQTMSCVGCHFVDQAKRVGLSTRSYAEFTEKSAIPVPSQGSDGKTHTPRNSPALLHAAAPRTVPFIFHYDGEFVTLDELVIGGFTGRNFGWLPSQKQEALDQIVKVIREDDGRAALAREFGGVSYRELLLGKSWRIPEEFRLPQTYRIDVMQASDQAVLNVVARLVSVYLESLDFSRDEDGYFNGSPYDRFLAKNSIPRGPKSWQSDEEYTEELTERIVNMKAPQWVTEKDGRFQTHEQTFAFGPEEFEGLKIFLRKAQDPAVQPQFVGNCVSCHAAPAFTDYRLHNVGETEDEYDMANGFGEFAKLTIPTLEDRRKGAKLMPENLDLGAWAVLGNPAMARPQTAIVELLCPSASCDPLADSTLALATFKTPSLRDLGHSEPYMHTGRHADLESALLVYVRASNRAKGGYMRVVDPEVLKMQLNPNAVPPLVKFLKSLNEDYN